MLLNLVAKIEILQIVLYHWVTSYGYIIVDSCIISFNLSCIMQLKQFNNIAIKVCSRESATTFGDLHDWWGDSEVYHYSETCL